MIIEMKIGTMIGMVNMIGQQIEIMKTYNYTNTDLPLPNSPLLFFLSHFMKNTYYTNDNVYLCCIKTEREIWYKNIFWFDYIKIKILYVYTSTTIDMYT